MTSSRIRVVDVAKALGLSSYTISRALNDHSDISEETKARVKAKAKELGYRPNSLARTLRRNKSETIGILLSPSAENFIDPYFLPILTGLDAVLTQARYSILVAGASRGVGEEEILNRLIGERRVDALVLTRVRVDDERVQYLTREKFPFVMLGRDRDEPGAPFVDADHFESTKVGVTRLVEWGHRRIALINTPGQVHASTQIHAGWQAALREVGLKVDPGLAREGAYTSESGRAIADELLAMPDWPTAFICGNDGMALGVAEAVTSRGLEVGRHVSIIGCDDVPAAKLHSPPLATFHTSLQPFGEALGQQILNLLAGKAASSHLFVPRLIERGSAGPRVSI